MKDHHEENIMTSTRKRTILDAAREAKNAANRAADRPRACP
jgi:hypothetical protein